MPKLRIISIARFGSSHVAYIIVVVESALLWRAEFSTEQINPSVTSTPTMTTPRQGAIRRCNNTPLVAIDEIDVKIIEEGS